MPRPKGSKGVGGQRRHCMICDAAEDVIPTGVDALLLILGTHRADGEQIGWLCLGHADAMVQAIRRASKKALDLAVARSE